MQNNVILELKHKGSYSTVLIRVIERRGRFSIHIVEKGRILYAKIITLKDVVEKLENMLWKV